MSPDISNSDQKRIPIDIQDDQVQHFKEQWAKISGDEQYLADKLNNLTATDQEELREFLSLKAMTLARDEFQEGSQEYVNALGSFIAGAVFIDDVLNTLPSVDQRIEIRHLREYFHFIANFPQEAAYDSIPAIVDYGSPNIADLIFDILDEEPEDMRPFTEAGMFEMFSLKMSRVGIFKIN